ncbi:odorant receptor 131-2-like [Leptodactylus fuscus]|uniref:odorant receptor 131-2-like n=1 Tax=Leptodactylus fuscus TaxID=238119 RepID=UPI003F4E4A25
MVNSSELQYNINHISITSSKMTDYALLAFILLITVAFGFFTYFIVMILTAFFTSPQLRDNARYVLFVYLLMNDTFFLILGFYMLLMVFYELYVPVPLCYVFYALSCMAYGVSPYNLAAMALEQYVAICHPLRHAEFCTTFRAHVAFTMICSLLTIPYAVELYVMFSSMTNIFNIYIICWQHLLVVNPIQNVVRTINHILCFSSVGIVILVTYNKIMRVARRASSRSSSASKAGKTVMLHAFQLLLCMASILSTFIESLPMRPDDVLIVTNFFIFTCVPRFLSPVIYGIRDETLREHMRRSLPRFFITSLAKIK